MARLAPFIASRDIRYYLCGLHIRSAAPKPGVYIEATDGAMLGVIYEPESTLECSDPAAGIIIKVSRELVSACRRSIRVPTPRDGSPAPVPRVLVHARRVSVAASHEAAASSLEWFVQPGDSTIEGRFPESARALPNWKRLMPEVVDAVSSSLLTKILSAAAGLPRVPPLTEAGASPVRFWSEGGTGDVVVVQFERIPNMVAVVMPMRQRDVKPEDMINRLVDQMPTRASKGAAAPAAERGQP